MSYEQIGVAMTCRSFEEYCRMFALEQRDLQAGAIVDIAAGASSFTAEAIAQGYDAFAADPLYGQSAEVLLERGRVEIEQSTAKLSRLADQFVWDYYGSLAAHRNGRERALIMFADHYRTPEGRSRYACASLPTLPYEDGTFSLVLCSHFLFLYAGQFDAAFHLQALEEMLRICRSGGEVRIYPLVTLDWKRYPEMELVQNRLLARGVRVEQVASQLPFIPGSTHVLRLIK